MSSYVSELDFYGRNPKLIGNDINIIEGQDIRVNQGDIDLITNVDSIYKSIIRRLYTSKLDFERLIKTIQGLVIIDETYGNDAFSYLSALDSDLNKSYVLEEIKRIINDDPRISLDSINLNKSGSNTIQIEVQYLILSNNQLAKLVI